MSRLVELFARAGIPFMVTGSMASVHFGEPRSTLDIDVVIDYKTGWKADLIVRKDRPFSITEFSGWNSQSIAQESHVNTAGRECIGGGFHESFILHVGLAEFLNADKILPPKIHD